MPEVYTREFLREINDFLCELYGLICNQEPYESLVPFVEAFVVDHMGKPLSAGGIFPGDPSDIASTLADENLFRINYPVYELMPKGLMNEDAQFALTSVFGRLPSFCLNLGKTSHQRKESVNGLRIVCEEYLELAGLPPHDAGRDPLPLPNKGVSLNDAAICIRSNDPEGQRALVKAWRNSRNPKLPNPVGKCPTHSQRNLYEPAALLRFLKIFEGEKVDHDFGLTAYFRRVSRMPAQAAGTD